MQIQIIHAFEKRKCMWGEFAQNTCGDLGEILNWNERQMESWSEYDSNKSEDPIKLLETTWRAQTKNEENNEISSDCYRVEKSTICDDNDSNCNCNESVDANKIVEVNAKGN